MPRPESSSLGEAVKTLYTGLPKEIVLVRGALRVTDTPSCVGAAELGKRRLV